MTADYDSLHPEGVMTPQEVADMFGVDQKTIVRWTTAGLLPVAFRTLGGVRRFDALTMRVIKEQHTESRIDPGQTKKP